MIALGCDIGSLFAKAVVFDGDDLVASRIMATTGKIADELGEFLAALARDAGIDRAKIQCFAGTGNGADLLKGADFVENIMTCIGAASCFYLPQVQLVIDIGGQSITSILLNQQGEVVNFMRNDKCASGSGRFLEVMSGKLKINMADIDEMVARATRPMEISAQCGVFAESEVITHVNAGEETPDIIAGVCSSVASIAAAQARRFGMADHYTLTGGVMVINSVANRIKEKLAGTYHQFPHNPQLAAAIGAALLAGSE